MGKNYVKTMEMPSRFKKLNKEEMEYLEGGKAINLPNREAYLSRSASLVTARKLKSQGYCVNMTETDIAKEIHAHAVVLFIGMPAAGLADYLGHPVIAGILTDIANHGADGIFLEDNPDSAARVFAYNAVWGLGRD